ncbi:hypothetical protein EYF80_040940 [Liparis tanakae]|uniref:Uncharacterized protein n=1 Tax=Liparis tanakae TaxID=230148 RepID=A0A4Z2G7U8_9TELE|nr:hypothetical protein EYF80_040940 [Liparis tanakae]
MRKSYPHSLQELLQRHEDLALHYLDLLVVLLHPLLVGADVTHSRYLIQDGPEVLQGVSDPLRVVQDQLGAGI